MAGTIWIGIVGIVITIACLWFCLRYLSWQETAADPSEIEYLERLGREHELGIANHCAKIQWLMRLAVAEYEPTMELNERLSRLREIIEREQPAQGNLRDPFDVDQ
jgi:hypothetical protein